MTRGTLRVLLALLLTTSVVSAKPKDSKRPSPAEKDKTKNKGGEAEAEKEATPPPEATPPSKPEPAPPGPGDRRRIVGILDVRVDGVPAEIASQFEKNLEDQLDSRAYWLAPMSRMRELMANSTKWTEGCLVGSCLREVKTQTNAELVVLASLTGSGTSFGYVVTLVRTDSGQMLAQEAERCDVCTVNEALTNATLSAVKLLTSLPDKLPDEAADQRAQMDLVTAKAKSEKRTMHHHHNAVAVGVSLAGLAIAAGGAAMYFAMDHSNMGLATAAAGGGIAAGGLIVLSF